MEMVRARLLHVVPSAAKGRRVIKRAGMTTPDFTRIKEARVEYFLKRIASGIKGARVEYFPERRLRNRSSPVLLII